MKLDILDELYRIILDRKNNPVEDSYTCRLFDGGDETIARKFGEESLELILAFLDKKRERIICEAADVMYHLFVLLASSGVELDEVRGELERRRRG